MTRSTACNAKNRRLLLDPLRPWLSSLSKAALAGSLLATGPLAANRAAADGDIVAALAVEDIDAEWKALEFAVGAERVEPTAEAPAEESPSETPVEQQSDPTETLTDEPPAEATKTAENFADDVVIASDEVLTAEEPAEAPIPEPEPEAKAPSEAEPEAEPAADTVAEVDPITADGTEDHGLSPAQFNGVTPGDSTRQELIEAWGEPVAIAEADGETDGGQVLSYEMEPFKNVEALIESDELAAIRVTLAQETEIDALVSRLQLEEVEPVEVNDSNTGSLLAKIYPEKGLTLLIATSILPPEAAQASHVVLEPLDARAFVLRAEQREERELTAQLADLATAIQIAPTDAHAHWLKAKTHLSGGQAVAAELAARKATRLKPDDPSYRLTLAAALHAVGDHDNSVLETRKVLDNDQAPLVVRAEGLNQMGRLAAMGAAGIAAKTIDFHNAAIEIADELATSSDDKERHIAKDALVSAHLAVAKEVARRDYSDKLETVAEWIGRASGLAEERIEADGGGLQLRLQVARESLAALAEMRPTKDPAPWVKEAEEAAEALLEGCDDPLFRARVQWELGEAYQHALRIEHSRGDAEQALSYGTNAIDFLGQGGEPRVTSPAAERLVGQLYFYLGAVNAVHRQDHPEAVSWYDKGRDILLTAGDDSEFVIPRRRGEELISMGVSYWTVGQKEQAIELTEKGAKLMEQAVAAGVMKRAELAVPYGNLATMHSRINDSQESAKYESLAQDVKPQAAARVAMAPQAKSATATQPAATAKPPSAAKPAKSQNRPQRSSTTTGASKRVAQQNGENVSPVERLSRRFSRTLRTLTR